MSTTQCDRCSVKYPDYILSTGFCGICALELSNQIHGDNRTKFTGETAEDFRRDAIRHRKKTNQKPKELT